MVTWCAILAVGGCGGDLPQRVSVSGFVTLDGAPLEFGSILFLPEGSGPMAGGTITAGHYTIEWRHGPVPGSMRVEIRAPRLATGQTLPDDPTQRVHAVAYAPEALPAKYNAASQLRVEITGGQAATCDFELRSK